MGEIGLRSPAGDATGPEVTAPGLRRLRAGRRRWTFALIAAAVLLGGASRSRSSWTGPRTSSCTPLPITVLRRIRWVRRLRAARRTGWRPAVVTVAPHRALAAKDHHAPDLEIGYRDGTTATARSAHAFRVAALSDRPRRPAWVAGTGKDLSVLFRDGPGGGPFLVPAAERVSGRGSGR
ncbi:hypothetical protein OG738_30720 [Amycolatopsis sp. NBC_01488]|uniref:hypothetical protein n=1 Tax=Amycolatopsis sp. NBC_01488 TaxID=2903563 RepID=UPI002E2C1156|nr:hypothetical protein [Amycolatopsis sp. NBC_01488]